MIFLVKPWIIYMVVESLPLESTHLLFARYFLVMMDYLVLTFTRLEGIDWLILFKSLKILLVCPMWWVP